MDANSQSTNEEFIDTTIKNLRANIPVIFRRSKDIPKLFGGCLAIGTLANMGKNGPPYAR